MSKIDDVSINNFLKSLSEDECEIMIINILSKDINNKDALNIMLKYFEEKE